MQCYLSHGLNKYSLFSVKSANVATRSQISSQSLLGHTVFPTVTDLGLIEKFASFRAVPENLHGEVESAW